MYVCPRCSFQSSKPLARCPGCQVVLIGVTCRSCGYSDAESVFVENHHRCPKCGSLVGSSGGPIPRWACALLAAGAFAAFWFTRNQGGPDTAAGRAILNTAALGLGLAFVAAALMPAIARAFLGGAIAGAFLSWPIGATVLNNLMGVDEPGPHRTATAIVMLAGGWIAHVKKRGEDGADSSFTTLTGTRQ